MKNPFIKFEKFGAICDAETRKIIAETIFDKLLNGLEDMNAEEFFLSDKETENFSTIVKIIIANPVLREMTKNDPELAETTTQEILKFIHQTKRTITALGNPYENEVRMLDSFSVTTAKDYKSYWEMISEFLNETYDKSVINTEFYTREFNLVIKKKKAKDEGENPEEFQSYESVRDHLVDRWREEILLKLTDFQKQKMEELQQQFCTGLNEQMEARKQMADMMKNFKTNFNEIFDVPKEGMSQENFDILKKFNELLKMSHAVRELVRMLGQMREAMTESEKEAINSSLVKFEWNAKHASRTDLIGIRESDDLNNLLPSETVLLSDPVLQTLFFKRFAEKKLQTFEFEDRTKSNEVDSGKAGKRKGKNKIKGPFIICVDTSSSMIGIPETIAKTICLAILKIALKENRNCYLITFSVGIVTLDMTNLKNNMQKIVDFLAMSFHGGTDASPALAEATKMIEKKEFERADVLMISDFEMPQIQDSVLNKIMMVKEKGNKFHSLVIGGYPNEDVVEGFDHNWHYDPRRKDSIFKLAKQLRKL